jgi:rubrerythrin
MFIDEDLLDFFSSMRDLEKQQRDFLRDLSESVDDPQLKERLLRISMDEQRHMDYVQRIIDLVREAAQPDRDVVRQV